MFRRRNLLFFSGSNKTPVTPEYNKGMFFLDVNSGDFTVNDTATPDKPNSMWVISTGEAVDNYCGLEGTNFWFTAMDENAENEEKPRAVIDALQTLVTEVTPSTISIDTDSLYMEQTDIEGVACLYAPGLVNNPSGLHNGDVINFTWASNIYINNAKDAFKPTDIKGLEMTGIEPNKILRVYKVGSESIFKDYDTSLTISYDSSTNYYRTIPLVCVDDEYGTETTCGIREYSNVVELYVDNTVYDLLDNMHSKSSNIFIRKFEGKLWLEDNVSSTYNIDLDPDLVYTPQGEKISDVGWTGPSLTVSNMEAFNCKADAESGFFFGDVFYIAKNDAETHLLLPVTVTPDIDPQVSFYVILGDDLGNLAKVTPSIDGAEVTMYDNSGNNPYMLTTSSNQIADILVSSNEDERAQVDNLNGGKMYANIFISKKSDDIDDSFDGTIGSVIMKVERIEECRFTTENRGGYEIMMPAIHRFYGLPTMNTPTIFKNM